MQRRILRRTRLRTYRRTRRRMLRRTLCRMPRRTHRRTRWWTRWRTRRRMRGGCGDRRSPALCAVRNDGGSGGRSFRAEQLRHQLCGRRTPDAPSGAHGAEHDERSLACPQSTAKGLGQALERTLAGAMRRPERRRFRGSEFQRPINRATNPAAVGRRLPSLEGAAPPAPQRTHRANRISSLRG